MGSMTIRRIDDDVLDKFKAIAKSHNRSAEAEARSLLEDFTAGLIARHVVSNADLVEEMRRLLDGEGLEEDEELCPPRMSYDTDVRHVDFGEEEHDVRL